MLHVCWAAGGVFGFDDQAMVVGSDSALSMVAEGQDLAACAAICAAICDPTSNTFASFI